jgi:hypothetical protein
MLWLFYNKEKKKIIRKYIAPIPLKKNRIKNIKTLYYFFLDRSCLN